ncbi:MAG: hypothetical protein HYX35_03690 [Proteobacteria bacterium]|nr:hypothetical protein [Pseudomonadota bacterium]
MKRKRKGDECDHLPHPTPCPSPFVLFTRAAKVATGKVSPTPTDLSYDKADDFLRESRPHLGAPEQFLCDFYRHLMQALDLSWLLNEEDEQVYAFLNNSYEALDEKHQALAAFSCAYMRSHDRISENVLSADEAYDLFSAARSKLPFLYQVLSDFCRAKMRARGFISDEKLTSLQAYNLFVAVQPHLIYDEEQTYVYRAFMRLNDLVGEEVLTKEEARLLLKQHSQDDEGGE